MPCSEPFSILYNKQYLPCIKEKKMIQCSLLFSLKVKKKEFTSFLLFILIFPACSLYHIWKNNRSKNIYIKEKIGKKLEIPLNCKCACFDVELRCNKRNCSQRKYRNKTKSTMHSLIFVFCLLILCKVFFFKIQKKIANNNIF